MSEEDVLKLGFKKEFSDEYNLQGEPDFYYYIKDITDGLTFISNGNDDMEGPEWYIEFWDTEVPIRYYEYTTVKMLFMLIEDGIIKTEENE